ncbi:glycosyltransferase family 1 protein [bacterium]|nr:MAG: glycosyltransferase family 1 protein [bacterium]
MKILLQNQYDAPLGGVETYFQLMLKALLEKGHEVIAVYTFSGKKNTIRRDNFKAFYLPNLDLPEEIYCSQRRKREIKQDLVLLRSIVEKEKPDVLHLNNTYYPAQFNFLRSQVPVIQSVHDFFNCCPTLLKMFNDQTCGMPSGVGCFRKGCVSPKSIRELWRFKAKYVNREAMKQFDRQLVTSGYMKEVLLSNGFEEDRVEVVPLFVEEQVSSGERQEDAVMYAGRLAAEKGVLHFIHMLKLIKHPFKAYIAGEGPLREECENLVKFAGLEDRVTFTGFLSRKELKEYFLKSAVVVVPSLWPEPFCLVGIEAMSFAKPVVAYNTGGISSWLRDNYNGSLAERGEIKELARAVETILQDKKLALNMGENGRLLFAERFTEQKHFARLFSIYEALVDRI